MIVDLRFLGVLEARWVLREERHHHVCLIDEGTFAEPEMYERESYEIVEPTVTLTGRWMPLEGFRSGPEPLHPQGLFELLAERR